MFVIGSVMGSAIQFNDLTVITLLIMA